MVHALLEAVSSCVLHEDEHDTHVLVSFEASDTEV